jgi:FAD binding domain
VRTLTALNQGKNQSCPFAVRSGGHGKSGFSNINGGVVIDLSALNAVSVREDRKVASIGPGATWGDVYGTLGPMNLTVPGGRHAGVGVGGLSLGGMFFELLEPSHGDQTLISSNRRALILQPLGRFYLRQHGQC